MPAPATIITDGSNTIDVIAAASFFLGADPSTTAVQSATTGTAVSTGFGDRPEAVPVVPGREDRNGRPAAPAGELARPRATVNLDRSR